MRVCLKLVFKLLYVRFNDFQSPERLSENTLDVGSGSNGTDECSDYVHISKKLFFHTFGQVVFLMCEISKDVAWQDVEFVLKLVHCNQECPPFRPRHVTIFRIG